MRHTRDRDHQGRQIAPIGIGMYGVVADVEDEEVPFDPSQLSTPPTLWLEVLASKVFSDTAGTVPAVAAGPVKRLNPSGSTTIYADDDAGAVAVVPVYYEDGGGRGWLKSTGAFERLMLSAELTMENSWTFWARIGALAGASGTVTPVLNDAFYDYVVANLGSESGGAFIADPFLGNSPALFSQAIVRLRCNGSTVFVSRNNADETDWGGGDITGGSLVVNSLMNQAADTLTNSDCLLGAVVFVPDNITDTDEWNNMDAYLRRIP